jgi:hypothetical protein
MKKIINLRRIGILALAAVLIFALFGCGDSDEGGNPDKPNNPNLPTELQNTNWIHTGGDKVQFGTNTVTVIPTSGSSRTFTLKSSTTVSEINQTTLYFGDSQTADFIVYRDGTISSVGLGGVQRTGGWSREGGNSNALTNVTSIGTYLSAQSGGDSTNNPVNLPINVPLTEANWKAILTAIKTAGKYVALDLSSCTRSTVNSGYGLDLLGSFNPIYDFEDGKDHVTSLILPNVATSIVGGAYVYIIAFKGFTSLITVSALTITTIGNNAFCDCTSLTSVSFPMATSIGARAFVKTSLTNVSFPAVTEIGFWAFGDCTSLTNVSFPTVVEIGEFAFDGCTSLPSVSFPAVISIGNNTFHNCTSLASVNLPQVINIGHAAFTCFIGGTTALTITLGLSSPTLGGRLIENSSKTTVTVYVPSGANGYGTIPNTYSGTDTTENWGNGFRGGGWDGSGFVEHGDVNSNITLYIQYQ